MMKLLIPFLYGLTLVIAALAIAADPAIAQSGIEPVNDLPNHYEATDGHLRMPIGRDWGAVGAIEVDPDGKSIWVAERCGSDSLNPRYTPRNCADSDLPVVLKFNSDGIMVRSFGGGLFAVPHGIHVDREGNVWVTYAPLRVGPPARGIRSSSSVRKVKSSCASACPVRPATTVATSTCRPT